MSAERKAEKPQRKEVTHRRPAPPPLVFFEPFYTQGDTATPCPRCVASGRPVSYLQNLGLMVGTFQATVSMCWARHCKMLVYCGHRCGDEHRVATTSYRAGQWRTAALVGTFASGIIFYWVGVIVTSLSR